MSNPCPPHSQVHLSSLLILSVGSLLACPAVALAQISPDSTLGTANSQVESGVMVRGALADLITGGSAQGSNLFHSFSQFNVAEGQRVYFANPDGIGAILSRVTGADPSQILGTLGVDGGADLFLLNPQGILFGPNARLDLSGSFQASTAERWIFADGQEFSAVNPQVAPLLTIQPKADLVYNTQFLGDITNEGRLAVADGETLTLAGAKVTNTGYLAAPAGTLQVLGHEIYLLDGSHLTVSAETGGGTVRVGGEYQGQGSLPRSRQTWVGENTLIEANALTVGDGGEVILWSDEATYFAGMIQAMGGPQGGSGGFGETSSAGVLTIPSGAIVDVRSPLGLGGQWLLDPRDITIVASGGTQASVAALSGLNSTTDGSIDAAVIAAVLSSGSSVTLTASQDIKVESSIAATPTANVTFTLQADRSIILNSGVGITGSGANTLSVVLNADRDATGGGAIVLNSGAQITTNNGNITLGGGANPLTTAAIGTAANPAGVTLAGVTLDAGTGTVSIRGQGAAGGGGDPGAQGGSGIAVSGSNTVDGATIALIGTGGLGGNAQTAGNNGGIGGTGIALADAAVIQASRAATSLDLAGTGGNGGDKQGSGQDGVGGTGILATNATIGAGSTLNLTGTGGSLGGPTTDDGKSVQFSGTVTLTGDEIQLNSTIEAVNANAAAIVLQPLSVSQNIQLGGNGSADNATTLTLTSTELGRLQDGFSSITIGRTTGTSTITLDSGLTLNDSMRLRGDATAGFTLQGSNTATTYALAATSRAGSITGGGLTFGTGATLTFENAQTINAGTATTDTVVGQDTAADTFALTATAEAVTANGITFTEIERVNAGTSGTDTVVGQNTAADTFALTANTGEVTTQGITFTQIEQVNAGSSSADTVTGQAGATDEFTLTANSGEMTTQGITFTQIEQVNAGDTSGTDTLTGQAGAADTFTLTGNNKEVEANNITFTQIEQVNAGNTAGTDLLKGRDTAVDTFNLSATAGVVSSQNITFREIEQVDAGSGNNGIVVGDNSTSETFVIAGSHALAVSGLSFSGIANVNAGEDGSNDTDILQGTAGNDSFTVTGPETIADTARNMTFTQIEALNTDAGSDSVNFTAANSSLSGPITSTGTQLSLTGTVSGNLTATTAGFLNLNGVTTDDATTRTIDLTGATIAIANSNLEVLNNIEIESTGGDIDLTSTRLITTTTDDRDIPSKPGDIDIRTCSTLSAACTGQITIRDTLTSPFIAKASADLSLSGAAIDLVFMNPGSYLESGALANTAGDLTITAYRTVAMSDTVLGDFTLATVDGDLLIQSGVSRAQTDPSDPTVDQQGILLSSLSFPSDLDNSTYIYKVTGSATLKTDASVNLSAVDLSTGDFTVKKLDGSAGDIIGSGAVISALGDVEFGSYTGLSLKVEATGSIFVLGDITIEGAANPFDTLSGFDSATALGNAILNFLNGNTTQLVSATMTTEAGSLSASALEAELGLNAGMLRNLTDVATEGSALKLTYTVAANATEVLPFAWDFSSYDYFPYNDFSFISVSGPGIREVFTLGSVDNPQGNPNPGSVSLNNSGSATSAIFTVGLGVVDVRDTGVQSNLVVTPVPGTDPDFNILSARPAAILRAGVDSAEIQNTPYDTAITTTKGGSIFQTSTVTSTLPRGSISVQGKIDVSGAANTDGDFGGTIILDAAQDIEVGVEIDSSSSLFGANGTILSTVAATTASANAKANGGDIRIQAEGDITLGQSTQHYNFNLGSFVDGSAGSFELNAGGAVNLNNIKINTTIQASSNDITANGSGRAGRVSIQGQSVTLTDTDIDAASFVNSGVSGTVNITATDAVLLTSSALTAQPKILTDTFTSDSRFDNVQTGGTINVTGRDVTIRNYQLNAQVSAGIGDGGDIYLTATGTAENTGTVLIESAAQVLTSVAAGATGTGGEIVIRGRDITLRDLNTLISADTASNTTTNGFGGGVRLTASNTIEVGAEATVSAQSTDGGQAGVINVVSNTLNLTNGGSIDSSSRGGTAGNITIQADNVTISGSQAEITSSAADAGTAGTISIVATGEVSVEDTGRLAVSATGTGVAGAITVNVPTIELNNGTIAATVDDSPGLVGSITLESNTLLLSAASKITADTTGSGAGGQVQITARDSVSLVENSFISASTSGTGVGGAIGISTDGILSLTGGSQIKTDTLDVGSGGSVTVTAKAGVSIDGSYSVNGSFLSGVSSTQPVVVNPANFADPSNFSLLSLGQSGYAYYTFGVSDSGAGQVATFDIDGGLGVDGSRGLGIDPTSIDTMMFLFDENGNLLARNDDSSADPGSNPVCDVCTSSYDSYLTYAFPTAGTYVLGIGQYYSYLSGDITNPLAGNAPTAAQTYQLNVSAPSNTFIVPFSLSTTIFVASGISARSESTGAGGNITLNTESLSVTNQGEITGTTQGLANGGNIIVNVQDYTGNTVITPGITLDNGFITTEVKQNAVNTASGQLGGNISLIASIGSVTLENGAEVTATSNGPDTAGTIVIQTPSNTQISVADDSAITSKATAGGQAGDIELTSGTLAIRSGGTVSVDAQDKNTSLGTAGSITVNAGTVNLNNGSIVATTEGGGATSPADIKLNNLTTLTALQGQISASTQTGKAGSVAIGDGTKPVTTVTLANSTIAAEATEAGGNAGSVTLYATALSAEGSIIESSNVSAQPGSGSGGSVILEQLTRLTLSNSKLSASTDTGTAGNVLVNQNSTALPVLYLLGDSLISVEADSDNQSNTGTGNGTAGQVVLNTNQLRLDGQTGRAVISAATENGSSQGIQIDNLNRLEIINGEITASTIGGNAANLSINNNGTALSQVYLNNGAISVAATGTGTAGQLLISTVDLTAENQSVISASTNAGQGQDILLQSLDTLTVTNSRIAASTVDGVAGSVLVNQTEAPVRTVRLNQGTLSVAATGTGLSGDILLNAVDLVMSNRSEISASTNSGTGGGVTLTNLEVLNLNNSDILATTRTGAAGSINMNSFSLDSNAVPVPIVNLLGESRISVAADTDGNISTGLGTGTAGKITLNATELFLQGNNRAQITASTENGSSQGIVFQNLDRLTVNQGDITATTVGGSAADLVIGNNNGVGLTPLSQILLNDGELSVEATGSGTAGQLIIITDTLTATNGSSISAATNSGQGQGVTLSSLQTLNLSDSRITASTVDGVAGNILLNPQGSAVQTASLDRSSISVAATGTGSSGSVNLNVTDLTAQNDSQISASTNLGVGGSVLLPTLTRLQVNNSLIQATTEAGEAGSVNISASQGIQVQGTLSDDRAAGFSVAATRAGQAGNLTVTTPELTIGNGASLSVAAGGSAQGGNLSITPWGSGGDLRVNLANGTISGSTEGSGRGGSLFFAAPQSLLIQGVGQVLAESSGSGTAGSISASSLYVTIADGVDLSTSATSSGRGGDINITAGNRFQLRNAQISTNAAGSGNGGDISVTVDSPARDLIFDNIVLNRGIISATSEQSQGGSLNFRANNSLVMYNNSLISTGAGQLGNGGDINIFVKFLIAPPLNNSDIVANAILGNGGRINLTAEGLFGFYVQNVDFPELDIRNNITVNSRFGSSGIVAISTTLDPSQGLTALAVDLIDPTSLIDRRCSLRSSASKSQFTLVGRGGLAPAPGGGLELSNPGDDLRLAQGDSDNGLGVAVMGGNSPDFQLDSGPEAQPQQPIVIGGIHLQGEAIAQGLGIPSIGDCQQPETP